MLNGVSGFRLNPSRQISFGEVRKYSTGYEVTNFSGDPKVFVKERRNGDVEAVFLNPEKTALQIAGEIDKFVINRTEDKRPG